jgi:hypothetical protein
VNEHVIQEKDLVVEEANLELFGRRLADLLSVCTQVSLDPVAASVDIVLSVGLHSKHALILSRLRSAPQRRYFPEGLTLGHN